MAENRTKTFSESSSSSNTGEGNVVVSKTSTDDGDSHFVGVQYGAINYGTGVVTFKPTDLYTTSEWSTSAGGGGSSGGPTGGSESSSTQTAWRTAATTDSWSTSPVRVRFKPQDGAPAVRTSTLAAQPFRVNLTPYNAEVIVPGSVMFNFAGVSYVDRGGLLYCDLNAQTGSGIVAGVINYRTGEATIGLWEPGYDMSTGNLFKLLSLLTTFGNWTAEKAFFRTAGSPIRPASLYVQVTAEDGTLITATADASGVMTGALARGSVQQEMGVARLEFGEMVSAAGHELEPWYSAAAVVAGQIWKPIKVIPGTLRYNCVVLSSLPLNADILGLDPVRLPSDGRVPIFRPADVVVIHSTQSFALPNPAVAGATYSVGRTDLSELWILDATGERIDTTHYVADMAAGTVTMAADLDLGTTAQPLVVRHRVEDLNLVSDVQINGQITLTSPLGRTYDAAETMVSSALLFGDLSARATGVFDQGTWTGEWSNTLIGAQATGQFNTIDYPLELLNSGAVTERWRIAFTNATDFQLIGESLGVIASGTTAADLQPVNGLTGLPYFTLRAAGWGAGWAAGNNLRFNTQGAVAPIWISRTVLPGATLNGDSIDLQIRGDVDA